MAAASSSSSDASTTSATGTAAAATMEGEKTDCTSPSHRKTECSDVLEKLLCESNDSSTTVVDTSPRKNVLECHETSGNDDEELSDGDEAVDLEEDPPGWEGHESNLVVYKQDKVKVENSIIRGTLVIPLESSSNKNNNNINSNDENLKKNKSDVGTGDDSGENVEKNLVSNCIEVIESNKTANNSNGSCGNSSSANYHSWVSNNIHIAYPAYLLNV